MKHVYKTLEKHKMYKIPLKQWHWLPPVTPASRTTTPHFRRTLVPATSGARRRPRERSHVTCSSCPAGTWRPPLPSSARAQRAATVASATLRGWTVLVIDRSTKRPLISIWIWIGLTTNIALCSDVSKYIVMKFLLISCCCLRCVGACCLRMCFSISKPK